MIPQPFKNIPSGIIKGKNHSINIFDNQILSENIETILQLLNLLFYKPH